jgi:hypothetical protein
MLVILVQLTLAPVLVAAATLAARHWHDGVGGVVSAFPAIVGPLLLITAHEHGPAFTARVADGTLLGLASFSAFVLVYGRLVTQRGWVSCLALGWAAAAAVALLVREVDAALPAGLLVAVATLTLAHRGLPASAGEVPRRPPRWDLPARLAGTTALVALLAVAAGRFGPLVGGILAALPVLASVLAVGTHRVAGRAAVLALLRGMLAGMSGFVVFCQLVAWLAVPAGPVAAFALATASAVLVQAVVAYSSLEPGRAMRACAFALSASGMKRLPLPCRREESEPPCTRSSPFIIPSNACSATCAGSSLSPEPTFVSSMSARSKNSVSVGPGMSEVTVTPVSESSSRMARANACVNDFEAL